MDFCFKQIFLEHQNDEDYTDDQDNIIGLIKNNIDNVLLKLNFYERTSNSCSDKIEITSGNSQADLASLELLGYYQDLIFEYLHVSNKNNKEKKRTSLITI